MNKKRIEHDFLGEKEVPAEAYWGIHTQRALQNFPISGYKVNPSLIKALALVKKACCLANTELEFLGKDKSQAIVSACEEIASGKFSDQFPVDALQGGAGTSTNMNMNEVIANRASEIMGGKKGEYQLVHQLADVNLHQSTNDTYPTAVKIAAINGLRHLSQIIAKLQGSFQEKEKAFGQIVKIGRTELQEAVPMTLGAEFAAFAEAISRDRWRTFKGEERLRVVNLGGTAIGTGITAPRDYIFLVIEKLREVTGLGLARGENLTGETANTDPFVEVSGVLKAHGTNLIKISGDLRLLNFIGEIHLPPLQAGSSIMPGKVNPVLMEAAIQTGIKVSANDLIVSDAASRGTLQISEFFPLIAHAFLESIDLLSNIDALLTSHISQIRADENICRHYFDHSPMIVTALLPLIGYDKSAALIIEYENLFKDDTTKKTSIRDFLENKLGKEIIEKAFSPYQLTALGYKDHGTDS
jgi:aspartate ammonia-lyase